MKFRTKLFLLFLCLGFLFFLNLYTLRYHSSSKEVIEDGSIFSTAHTSHSNEGNQNIGKPVHVENDSNDNDNISVPPKPSKEEEKLPPPPPPEKKKTNEDWDWSDEYLRAESKRPKNFVTVTYNPKRVEECPHMVTRDLTKDPMKVSGGRKPEMECSINYDVTGNNPDVQNGRKPKCGYSYKWSMENIGVRGADLPGNTNLQSEVPVPYFSWRDFGLYDEGFPVPKTEKSLASVFISNCGPKKRLDVLTDLQKHGVAIDSYGKCKHNKDEPDDVKRKHKNVFQRVKMEISSRYKFLYSPENGETTDYITEKFFLPFCIGTVPIYLGAPNARDFAPAPNSFIHVADFKNSKELADYILEIANDEEKYESFLKWKVEGPSRHFIALMDLNNVHSSCRFALRGADYMRKEFNNSVGHEKLDRSKLKKFKRYFRVRERNTFYLKYVYLTEDFTMWDLESEIKKVLGWNDLYKIYHLWDRAQVPIGKDEIGDVKNDEELEVVFLDSQIGKRDKFDDWMKRSGKKLSDFK